VVNGTTRIAGDLGDFAVFGIDQNAATAMTHSAMAFDNPIKPVNLYFPLGVGIFKFGHISSLLFLAAYFKFNRSPSVKKFCFPGKITTLGFCTSAP
jgi:hypothetical protein